MPCVPSSVSFTGEVFAKKRIFKKLNRKRSGFEGFQSPGVRKKNYNRVLLALPIGKRLLICARFC
jgi:hypothetical protein